MYYISKDKNIKVLFEINFFYIEISVISILQSEYAVI
jgi:hypothetical protein